MNVLENIIKNSVIGQKKMVIGLFLGLIVFQSQGMQHNSPKMVQDGQSAIWRSIAEGKTLKMLEKRDLYNKDCKKFAKLNKNIEKHDPCTQLRCMTYNVHFWQGKDHKSNVNDVMANVQASNPDVVCLQEVIWNDSFKLEVTRKFAELGYVHGGASLFIAGKGALGNTIFSKYQLTDCVKKCFKTPFVLKNKGGKEQEEFRAFTGGTVMFNNTPVRIYCLHLDVWDETGVLRREEMEELIDHINQHDSKIENVMFMGDFNAVRKQDYQYDIKGKKVWGLLVADDRQRKIITPTFEVEDYLESIDYKDVYTLVGKKPVFTVWSGKIVDFIYFKPGGNLVCKDVNPYYSSASDHVPVIVDCVVNTKKSTITSKL